MAISNHERVGKALELLKNGLQPFVERELKEQHKQLWFEEFKASLTSRQLSFAGTEDQPRWDVATVLKVMWDQWHKVFRKVLDQSDRSIVSELRDVRNRWAHQNLFSSDDAYRALDSVSRLLATVSAPQAGDVKKMKMELLRVRFDEQVRSENARPPANEIGDMEAREDEAKAERYDRKGDTTSAVTYDTSLPETRRTQKAYWTAFHLVLDTASGPITGNRKPLPRQWSAFSVGRTGFQLAAVTLRKQNQVRAELYISGDNAKAFFGLLKQQKDPIEQELNYHLKWEELPARQDCRIAFYLNSVNPEEESDWLRQHEWLAKRLNDMHGVFARRIRELNADDWRRDGESVRYQNNNRMQPSDSASFPRLRASAADVDRYWDEADSRSRNNMTNPWLALPPSPPYVLPDDRTCVEAFNAKLPPDSPRRIEIEAVIPEPFVGAVKTAPVVVLLLNPGFGPEDAASHADPEFRTALISNLRHVPSKWPFYFFDPRFRDTHPGGRWWIEKTKRLAEEVIPLSALAQRLAVVEWFPYKSTKHNSGSCRVLSQDYGFSLVAFAMERGALVVIARSVPSWESSVPALQNYPRKLTLSSSQNVALTPNNVKLNGEKTAAWELLVNALRRVHS